ncbi:MAG: glutamyl-tRNA reductase, partial [Clostridia bacterium]|nr:glutamyl-tRNA reductase [Clostridia bacterium]
KEAHEYSINNYSTKTILNKLFREAITTAKKIKRETKISENALSVSSIAVKLIESKLGDLSDKKALIVGAGKMNKIVIENLIYKGIKNIYVTNRTKCHVMDLSCKFEEVECISFKDRYERIPDVDIIVSSTSAPHYVIHQDSFIENYNCDKEICIVDIALPRDVDPCIGSIKGVSLYDIDELETVVSQKHRLRLEAANIAVNIIREDCVKFGKWYNCLSVFPVIREIEAYSTAIVSKELADFLSKIEHLEQKEKNQIQLFTKSLVKKLFRTPLHELKRAGENEQGELYAKITKEIFRLNNIT